MTDVASTTPMRRKSEWQKEGACLYVSEEKRKEFLEYREGRPSKNDPRKEICEGCPVRAECLAYAIVHDEFGIWGGTSKGERQKLPQKIKKQLTEKAIEEGWYNPLKDYLPQVQYATPAPIEEETLDSLECPLDRQPARQEFPDLPFLRQQVPAFSLT